MLQRRNPKLPETINVTGPAIVKVKSGVEVHIDAHNNVTIVGQNSLKFKCEGDMEFEADNITMRSKETYRIEGGKHLVQKADRIDLNPVNEPNLIADKNHTCDKCNH